METPSDWAKRFNQQKTDEAVARADAEAVKDERPAPTAEFPRDPFPCPACGQLLAPSCRVCVACKRPIDPAEIVRAQAVASPAASAAGPESTPERVPYPWPILFAVLGVGLILGLTFMAVWGEQKGQVAIQTLPVLAGIWVFFDAVRRRIPRPLRWGLGTMLLLAVIFPWYLARRRKPQARVPFVEAEAGPVARFLLIALLIFFLASMILYMVQGPPPGSAPNSQPKQHGTAGGSQPRITHLDLWFERGRWKRPQEKSRVLRRVPYVQAEISAPSDARQT